jgi:hypothetical protein
MKKTILFYIALISTFIINAQTNLNLSANVSADGSGDEVLPYTQKALGCDIVVADDPDNGIHTVSKYRSITLSNYITTSGQERSKFILNEEAEGDDGLYGDGAKFIYVNLPDTIKVYDIYILDSVLYYCGKITPPLPLVSNSQYNVNERGFIAYIPIRELFSALVQINMANYISIGFEVKKVIAFKDENNNGNISLFAMCRGRELYDPIAIIPSDYTPTTGSSITTTWYTPPPTYKDFTILYNTINGTCFSMLSNDEITLERFQDINVSKGLLELVSLRYNDTVRNTNLSRLYASDNTEISNKLVCRKFTTTNPMQQFTSYFNIRWMNAINRQYYDDDVLKGIYNVKLRDLYNEDMTMYHDTLLLSFNHYESTNNYYATIINKLQWNVYDGDNFIRAVNSMRIWEGTSVRRIWDIGTHLEGWNYIQDDVNRNNNFVALYQSPINTNFDAIELVNLAPEQRQNYFLSTSTSLTDARICTIPYANIFLDGTNIPQFHFNSILDDCLLQGNNINNSYYRGDFFRIAGVLCNYPSSLNYNNYLAFFQYMKTYRSNTCQSTIYRNIVIEPYPIYRDINDDVYNLSINNSYVRYGTMTILKGLNIKSIGNCINEGLNQEVLK